MILKPGKSVCPTRQQADSTGWASTLGRSLPFGPFGPFDHMESNRFDYFRIDCRTTSSIWKFGRGRVWWEPEVTAIFIPCSPLFEVNAGAVQFDKFSCDVYDLKA